MQQQQHPCCLNSHIFLSSQQTIKRFSTLGWSCVRFEGSLGRSRLFLSRLVPLKEDKLHRSGPSTWWMLNSLFPLTHVSCMIQTVTLPFTTHSVTLLAALICSCSWYFVHPCWLQVACVVASWRDAVVKRLRCVSRTVGHYSPPPPSPRRFRTQTNRPKQNGGAGGGGIKTFKLELSHQCQWK